VNGRACGRRVAKLYGPGTYFLCRHCYDLRYSSQREQPMERARERTQAIRVRLGGTANLTQPFPPKPKGMHWRTYHRLRREAEEAEHRYTMGLMAWLRRTDARLDRITKMT